MKRQTHRLIALIMAGLMAGTGCTPTQPFYYAEDGDLSHYLDRATELEYPDVETMSLADTTETHAPLTLSDPEFAEIWEMSLEEAISIALQNSKIIRLLGDARAQPGQELLLSNPLGRASIFDVAIDESSGAVPGSLVVDGNGNRTVGTGSISGASEAIQGSQGVEAALAEFDAVFSSSLTYNKTDRSQNSVFAATQQDDGTFQSAISKRNATGGVLTARNNTTYQETDLRTITRLPSSWVTSFEAEYRQPWFRGRGTMINRIPIMLGRISTDMTLSDFEAGVRNLVSDVENAYWDLHCAYRQLETAKAGRDATQGTWKIVYEKWRQGVETGQAEAQAREQYFNFRAQVENALSNTGGVQGGIPGVYPAESNLRYLLGLAATDGRLIRPKDEPTTARVEFEWREILQESLIRSTELRKQKWRITGHHLRVKAAKNSLLPQIDSSIIYRWVGAGDDLIDERRNGLDFPSVGSTAFDELTGGRFQEVQFGLTVAPPSIGARRELVNLRREQLLLTRAKAQLEDMELNTAHLLTTAVRHMDTQYHLAQTHFNRVLAAEEEVQSLLALYQGGKATLDLVLEGQRRRAQAQIDYYRALCTYQTAIAGVHFRKGSLLEYNNVALSEGSWPHKAYWDAYGRARERDASYYMDYGWTRPGVISAGRIPEGMSDQGIELVEPPRDGNVEPQRESEELPELPAPGPITGRPSERESGGLTLSNLADAAQPKNAFPWGSLGLKRESPADHSETDDLADVLSNAASQVIAENEPADVQQATHQEPVGTGVKNRLR